MSRLCRSVCLQKRGLRPSARLVLLLALSSVLAASAYTQTGSPVAEGSVAPDFELKTLEAKSIRLSDYRGKVVLLNFWATWCTPCKRETPIFVQLHNEYRQKGLAVIGVDQDDPDIDTVKKFVADERISYPIVLSDDDVQHEYIGARGLPVTFLIGADGKVLKKISGAITSRSEVEDVLKSFTSLSH